MIDTKKLREFVSGDMWRHHSSHVVLSILDELDRVTEELGLAMGTLESRDRNIEAMAEEYRRVTEERDALKVDAERFDALNRRFLAADFSWGDPPTSVLVFEFNGPVSADLRKTIDAAIRASKEKT